MSDPNMHWDGQHWLHWNGSEWETLEDQPAAPKDTAGSPPPPAPPPPRKSHTGLIVTLVVGGLALVLIVAGGLVWLFMSAGSPIKQAAGTTPITTLPVNAQQSDPFTEPVGQGRSVTSDNPDGQVTVPGGQTGLYGGTRNETVCDKTKLTNFLMANPDKGRAWATVLGITFENIPRFIAGLTPMLLTSDTLVMNHGYKNGQATQYLSVLQAGTAVLVGKKGLPVVRCSCGNPLTPPPTKIDKPVWDGDDWDGWNPGSITIIQQNTTIIDIFVVTDVDTGDEFTTPAGSNGTATGTTDGTSGEDTTGDDTSGEGEDTSAAIDTVSGMLSGLLSGDPDAAGQYTGPDVYDSLIGPDFSSSELGALISYEIQDVSPAGDSVAVTVWEEWEGGTRQNTYYVQNIDGTWLVTSYEAGGLNAFDEPTDTSTADPYATEDPYGWDEEWPTDEPTDEYGGTDGYTEDYGSGTEDYSDGYSEDSGAVG